MQRSGHGLKSLRNFTAGVVQDVAILGGGITGLATAYFLTRDFPQARVTIYESSPRLGGWISSKRVPVKDGNVLFEAGPRTLRPSGNGILAGRLLQELDLAKHAIFPNKTTPAAQNRFLYYPNHLVLMPHPAHGLVNNFWQIMREPIFKGVIWSMITEIGKTARDPSQQDESLGSFISRRFSSNIVDRLLSGVIHGIYAGDVWQLSMKSLFPVLWRDEMRFGSIINGIVQKRAEGLEVTKNEVEYLQSMKEYTWDPRLKKTLENSVVFTFKDGLSTLTDGLARALVSTGTVQFNTSTSVKSITLAEDKNSVYLHTGASASREPQHHQTVISALSPTALNHLRPKGSAPLIDDIPYVTVMTVTMYFRTPGLHPPGFGYLIPRATPFENNPERALGVVFDDAYSPPSTGPGGWTVPDEEAFERARQAGEDLDPRNPEHLMRYARKWDARDTQRFTEMQGQVDTVNWNGFIWYNLPNPPNKQDEVPKAGTKLTVMLGGHWWDSWPSYPDEKEGLALARSLLERHLGIKEEPEAWQVNLQKDCIPQYTVGHEQRLKDANTNLWREYNGRVRVAGNWMMGVGVNDCLRSAWEVVKGLREGKAVTGLENVGSTDFVRMMPVPPGQKDEEKDDK